MRGAISEGAVDFHVSRVASISLLRRRMSATTLRIPGPCVSANGIELAADGRAACTTATASLTVFASPFASALATGFCSEGGRRETETSSVRLSLMLDERRTSRTSVEIPATFVYSCTDRGLNPVRAAVSVANDPATEIISVADLAALATPPAR